MTVEWATLEGAFKIANRLKANAALKRSRLNPADERYEYELENEADAQKLLAVLTTYAQTLPGYKTKEETG
jgi:hypothetical protein